MVKGGVDVIRQLGAANQPQLLVRPNAWGGGKMAPIKRVGAALCV